MDGMDAHTKAFRSNMRGLQAGIRAIASNETRIRETQIRMENIQEETNRHKETTGIKCIETREIEKIEERLHDQEGVKDEHTHTRR